MNGWIIFAVALLYLASLFAIASYGDRIAARRAANQPRPLIYALSLTVYCTSWTYFGSVGLSAERGFEFLGIYLGPILMFTVGFPLVRLIVQRAKSENITSIADFLGARYGKSAGVAALAAIIAVVGIVPYIALQLKAISDSVRLLSGHYGPDALNELPLDMSLLVAGLLSVFAILFGTRHADATEHQDGLILAIAVESIVKLASFLIVGIVVTFFMFGGMSELVRTVNENVHVKIAMAAGASGGTWIVLTMLSAFAILMLPRQFHVTVVENRSASELKTAAWLFPLYLVLINVFVFPIAVIGLVLLGNTVSADLYVLALPMSFGADFLTLLTFLGGLSAATAMVIVASVALAIMISNDLVIPALLRRFGASQHSSGGDWSLTILNIRRVAIFVILMAAFLYYRGAANNTRLASIGLLSFAAVAQFAPAMLIGLAWRKANGRGAMLGMGAGFIVWAYTLLLPTLSGPSSQIVAHGLFGFSLLKPQALFGFNFEPLSHGVFWSLFFNTLFLIAGSLSRAATPLERIQAAIFVPREAPQVQALRRFRTSVTVDELKTTIARYVGTERTERSFILYADREGRKLPGSGPADMLTIRFAEQLLASAIGSSSARLVLSLMMQKADAQPSETMRLLDDASEALQQNRDLLQIALDQMEQGITVLDSDFRLTCWNRQFRLLLDLPPEIGQFGTPLTEILDALTRSGQTGETSVSQAIEKLCTPGVPWRLELRRSSRILEIRSNPMPDGGLVTTYSDITSEVKADIDLKRAYEGLEQRVTDRTIELTKVNQELARAREAAEQANISKTRFLAAAGHDILQPLNAARLYSSSLVDRLGRSRNRAIVQNIDSSLEAVETILGAVLDISRLDSGVMKPSVSVFRLDDLFNQIRNDFRPVAEAKGLELRIVPTGVKLRTDRNLLRRLIQNLVSNAIKYTPSGRVLVGVRRKGSQALLEIHDTGIGIPEEKSKIVFQEFMRLDEGAREASGLGLGLSIVDRISRVLGLRISLSSKPGKGTRFTVTLPVTAAVEIAGASETPRGPADRSRFDDLTIACIDNDRHILDGMRTLLEGWGCRVTSAADRRELIRQIQEQGPVDLLLADYHLNEDRGLDVILAIRELLGRSLPSVLITADRTTEVRNLAAALDVVVLHKPLKPAALRAVISQLRHHSMAAE